MTGFEPGSSGIESDRSANCATTTAPIDIEVSTSDICSISIYQATVPQIPDAFWTVINQTLS